MSADAADDCCEIDALITEYRQHGGSDIVAKIEQLIQNSAGNQKQEKLEAFLREVIATKQHGAGGDIKMEPPVLDMMG